MKSLVSSRMKLFHQKPGEMNTASTALLPRIRSELLATSQIMRRFHLELQTSKSVESLMAGGRFRLAVPAIRFIMFSFLVFASCYANADNEPSGDENKVVWQNPTPQLSQTAARSLLAAKLGGLDSAGYMLVIVRLDGGKTVEVRS